MSPKKSSGTPAIHQALQDRQITSPDRITEGLLLEIYKLKDSRGPRASSSDGGFSDDERDDVGVGPSHTTPRATPRAVHRDVACHNLWSDAESAREVVAWLRAIRNKKRKTLGVANSNEAAAKGKERARDGECNEDECCSNPRCLNWLGQARWEDDKLAYRDFAKAWGLGDDPAENMAEPDLPIGLKNLGATCYANSLLQVWFQNVIFRAGVYSCRPATTGRVDASPLFQLQVIFAALQAGHAKAFNPVELVRTLRLDSGEQQDAQEFAKLFMDLLDREFKKQPDPLLRTLVADQFEGRIRYGTRCLSCNTEREQESSYKEFELTLKNNARLENLMSNAIASEVLEGDNKYRCENCGRLRKAVRYSKVVSLPPVLHFSLLRFVFDPKKMERKKSNATILYPKSINMGQFLGDRHSSNQEVWYDLQGALLHKGTSAYHGHYVANIFDARYQKWFLFDDETVTESDPTAAANGTATARQYSSSYAPSSKGKGKGTSRPTEPWHKDGKTVIDLAETTDDDESDGPTVSSTPAKKGNDATTTDSFYSNGDSGQRKRRRTGSSEADSPLDDPTQQLMKTRDAYMLVYVKRGLQMIQQTAIPPIPEAASRKLADIESTQTLALEAWTADSKRCEAEFERIREAKRSVYTSWEVKDPRDEEGCLVVAEELEKWMTSELEPSKKGKSRKTTDGDGASSSSGKPASDNGTSHGATTNGKSPNPPSVNGDTDMQGFGNSNATAPSASQNGGLVNGAAGEESRVVSFNHLDNSEVVCPHGGLIPALVGTVKCITQTAACMLSSLGVEMTPVLTTRDSLCRDCVWKVFADKTYGPQHMEHLRHFKARAGGQAGACWISKAWLTDWQRNMPRMHIHGQEIDPAPDTREYRGDVLCTHDGLTPWEDNRQLINGKQTAFLQKLFPAWEPPRAEENPCVICEEDYLQHKQVSAKLNARAREEKNDKTLKRLHNSFEGIPMQDFPLEAGDIGLVVPRSWLHTWRRWIRSPSRYPLPEKIDLRAFLCEKHTHFLHDLNFPDDKKRFEVVSASEWQSLKELYGSKNKLYIEAERKYDGSWTTNPGVCTECRHETTFEEATIRVVFLVNADMDTDGLPKDNPTDPLAVTATMSDDHGRRRSGRQKKPPGSSLPWMQRERRQPVNIDIKRNHTLKDIRVKIEDRTGIQVLYQRVFFNRREIEDSQETVETIGITEGESLLVLEVKQDIIDMDEVAKEVVSRAMSRFKSESESRRSEGFSGTGLLGNDTLDEDDSMQDINDPEENLNRAMPGTCPACTFQNQPTAKECEICGKEF